MDLLQSHVPTLQDLLEPAVMNQLEAACRIRWFQPDQLIHRRGDQTQGLSLIRQGHVNSSNVGLDGSMVSTSVLGPGQCFGEYTLFAGLPRTHDVIAIDSVELGNIAERTFFSLTDQYPQIVRALLTISLRRSYALLEFLDSLRRLPLEMRMAKLLLAQVRHLQEANRQNCIIHCNQEDLASTLGVTRISVSKVLARLEAGGLVKRGYRQITVTDATVLGDWVSARDQVVPLAPEN
ncbi:MAG: Crp/Fnr family transcriptional regulator [Pseudomonadales bacterium]|nr:Crp/Fnr family transcriptional regulator [Pseudomonadales bacterium]